MSRLLKPTGFCALAGTLVLSLAVGGCISVFPKAKPVQLYRFGEEAASASGARGGAMVLKGATVFPPAVAGDRLLTVNGAETAYIAGARWVAPASILFDDALVKAFDAPGAPRLVQRGEPLAAPSTLRLDVRTFEARYPGPSALVEVRATLIRNADHSIVAEKMFAASSPAAANRQGAIVAAFDGAAREVIGAIRDWTAATAPAR